MFIPISTMIFSIREWHGFRLPCSKVFDSHSRTEFIFYYYIFIDVPVTVHILKLQLAISINLLLIIVNDIITLFC